MFNKLIINDILPLRSKDKLSLESIAYYTKRLINKNKALGYGVNNPRNKTNDRSYRCKTVMDSYIDILKEKLKVSTDYAERKVRLYIYDTLLQDKMDPYNNNNEVDIHFYQILYGKYLQIRNENLLKSRELSVFNEIEDAYFMFSGPTFQNILDLYDDRKTEPFISVQSSISKTIVDYREKLRDSLVYQGTCGDNICEDYIVEFTTMTPMEIL